MSSCYYPNGDLVTKTSMFQVCQPPPGKTFGMCCATQNRDSVDWCQKDANGDYTGLCLGGKDSLLYRNSCSDQKWGPDCLKLCTSGFGNFSNANDNGNMAASDWPITACGDGTYCCDNGANGTSCCQHGNGYYIVDNQGVKEKPASLAATGSTNTTATGTAVAISSSKSSAGAIAGGAVGGFVAGAVIAAIAFLIYSRFIRKRQPEPAPAYGMDGGYPYYGDQKVAPGPAAVEAPNEPAPHELMGNGISQKP